MQALPELCISLCQTVESYRKTKYVKSKHPTPQQIYTADSALLLNVTGGTQAPTQPSKYCDVIVEQLIMPITEGALSLDGQSQIAYMTLTTSTLLNEYRKFILRNKHTQRYIQFRLKINVNSNALPDVRTGLGDSCWLISTTSASGSLQTSLDCCPVQ